MNILILTHSYPDAENRWRGIFIQEQVKALSLRHNIILVYFKVDYSKLAPFKKYKALKRKASERITEYELTTARSFPVINQVKYLLDTYRFIKSEILANNKIDLIHSHLTYPAGFLAAMISKKVHLPFVLTEHSRIQNYHRSLIHRLCVRFTIRNTPVLICVSNVLRQEILKSVKSEIAVVHNAIDVQHFKPADKGPKHDLINIGFLGSLKNPNKGLDILLTALSTLKEPDLRLHIGGDGRLRATYIKMAEDLGIKDSCIFYGEISPDSRLDFYSRLDLFVLPSRSETFGMVLVEAMSCGIPVIATNCGGPAEIVSDGTGFLVEKDDPEGLARAITRMVGEIKSFDRVAIREYAIRRFSHEALADNLTAIYKILLMKDNPV